MLLFVATISMVCILNRLVGYACKMYVIVKKHVSIIGNKFLEEHDWYQLLIQSCLLYNYILKL